MPRLYSKLDFTPPQFPEPTIEWLSYWHVGLPLGLQKSLGNAMQTLNAEEVSLQRNIVLLRFVSGIGKFRTAVILAELGDISLFYKPEQLSAYIGIDPSDWQLASFTKTNIFSKRGSPQARTARNMPALNAKSGFGRLL